MCKGVVDVYSISVNSVVPRARYSRYCALCSQVRSSVGCEARYIGTGPMRPCLRACGCARRGQAIQSFGPDFRWRTHTARESSSKQGWKDREEQGLIITS